MEDMLKPGIEEIDEIFLEINSIAKTNNYEIMDHNHFFNILEQYDKTLNKFNQRSAVYPFYSEIDTQIVNLGYLKKSLIKVYTNELFIEEKSGKVGLKSGKMGFEISFLNYNFKFEFPLQEKNFIYDSFDRYLLSFWKGFSMMKNIYREAKSRVSVEYFQHGNNPSKPIPMNGEVNVLLAPKNPESERYELFNIIADECPECNGFHYHIHHIYSKDNTSLSDTVRQLDKDISIFLAVNPNGFAIKETVVPLIIKNIEDIHLGENDNPALNCYLHRLRQIDTQRLISKYSI